jgi:hypothetical protein
VEAEIRTVVLGDLRVHAKSDWLRLHRQVRQPVGALDAFDANIGDINDIFAALNINGNQYISVSDD